MCGVLGENFLFTFAMLYP